MNISETRQVHRTRCPGSGVGMDRQDCWDTGVILCLPTFIWEQLKNINV